MTNPLVKHVALPALAPAALIGLYFTPVLLFGCVNRGLLAVGVALLAAAAAFVTVACLLAIAWAVARRPERAAGWRRPGLLALWASFPILGAALVAIYLSS